MSKKSARALAAFLAAGMVVGALPLSASATSKSSGYAAPAIKFSSTQNLINATIDALKAEGKGVVEKDDDYALEDKVKEKSGLTLSELKTMLGLAIYQNRKDGVIDTSKYHLKKSDMESVLKRTLSDNYLTDVVKYELYEDEESGEVAQVAFTLNASTFMVFDEIESNSNDENSQRILEEAKAEAEAEAIDEGFFRPSWSGGGFGSSGLLSDDAEVGGADSEGSTDEAEKHEHDYTNPQYFWYLDDDTGLYACKRVTTCAEDGDAVWDDCDGTPDEDGVYTAYFGTEGESTFIPADDEHECTFKADSAEDFTTFWQEDKEGGYSAIAYVKCVTDDDSDAGEGEGSTDAGTDSTPTGSTDSGEDSGKEDSSSEDSKPATDTTIPESGEDSKPATDTSTSESTEDSTAATDKPATELSLEVYSEEETTGPSDDGEENTPAPIKCELVKFYVLAIESKDSDDGNSIIYTAKTIPEAATDSPIDVATKIVDKPTEPVEPDKPVDPEEPEGHVHDYECVFKWEEIYVANDDGDGDGSPDMALYWDSETKQIAFSDTRKLDMNCTGAVISCSDEDCDMEDTTIPVENITKKVQYQYINNTTYEEYSTENPGEVDQNQYTLVAIVNIAACGLDENNIFSDYKNVSEISLTKHWNEMASFVRDNAEYFGVSAPYWTSKDTEATPMGAIKSLMNMELDAFVPDPTFDYYVNMLTQAFISYEYMFGAQLLEMRDAAVKYIESAGEISDIQKLLLLHDWLSKVASFDMNSLVTSRSGGSSDPISMTGFAALLNKEQLVNAAGDSAPNADGAVCLGYASAYTYLAQNIFPGYKDDEGNWITDGSAEHIVDFVQIKFNADVSESSVAGDSSGFGENAVFNEPHYFNAVKINDTWYYVDACYDDISTEVISQYRVETDGYISHKYFMTSPQSIIDQFDGNFDYFDSAYDGWTWTKTEDGTDEDGNTKYIYVQTESDTETKYDDTQYEQTWFSGAVSEILFDENNWYYVEGDTQSYSGMKDMFESDQFDSSSLGQLLEYKNDPAYANKLRSRPKDEQDEPANKNDNGNSQFGSMSQYEDAYANTIFHYGYGAFGDVEDYGDYKELIELDNMYRDMYPDLNHSLAIYDGVMYINIADKIMMIENFTDDVSNLKLTELKDYDTVNAMTNGRAFTGMSFFVAGEDDEVVMTLENHPIGSLTINQVVKNNFEYIADGNGNIVGQKFTGNTYTPTLTVSVATNYSNSNPDDEDNLYKKEAINFNPSYYRFMDDDDDVNKNTEFMWCANVVENIAMSALLEELETEGTSVKVEATCSQNGYTQNKTDKFGLSVGEKTEATEAIGHHCVKVKDGDKDVYICVLCDHCFDALTETDDDGNVTVNGHELNVPKFNWISDSKCTFSIGCGETDCQYETESIDCEVTFSEDVDENGDPNYCIAKVNYRGTEYSDTKEYSGVIKGDVNADGKISTLDIFQLCKYVNEEDIEINLYAADVNGDGKISTLDIFQLCKIVNEEE